MRDALVARDSDFGLDARSAFYPQVIHGLRKCASTDRLGGKRKFKLRRKNPATREAAPVPFVATKQGR
jgi:hypothetical protein